MVTNMLMKHARHFLAKANISVTKQDTFDRLIHSEQQLLRYEAFLSFTDYLKDNYLKMALSLFPDSKGEIFQDIFIALLLKEKKNGFFVDFGATNGSDMSNSWMLEKKFGWNGIVAEPGRQWQKELWNNRNCVISNKCVWKESNKKILFNETINGGFSTIDLFSSGDRHFRSREHGQKYYVETVSLNDLLTSFNSPRQIDYLSIDTEGSEFEILSTHDFTSWDISIITVEHNFTDKREEIHTLLESKGFIRILTSVSRFDDWYIKPQLIDRVKDSFKIEAIEG